MLLSNFVYKLQTLKTIALSVVMVSSMIIAGCTVQPLYKGSNNDGSPKLNANSLVRAKLSSIEINEVNDRTSQIVRNRLIYLFNGGAGQSAAPQYSLSLKVNTQILSAVQVNIGDRTERTGRASAGSAHVTGIYTIRDLEGKVIAQRSRFVSSSFDRPRQEYANLSAEQDAKERAANELAEQLYLSIAQDMAKK